MVAARALGFGTVATVALAGLLALGGCAADAAPSTEVASADFTEATVTVARTNAPSLTVRRGDRDQFLGPLPQSIAEAGNRAFPLEVRTTSDVVLTLRGGHVPALILARRDDASLDDHAATSTEVPLEPVKSGDALWYYTAARSVPPGDYYVIAPHTSATTNARVLGVELRPPTTSGELEHHPVEGRYAIDGLTRSGSPEKASSATFELRQSATCVLDSRYWVHQPAECFELRFDGDLMPGVRVSKPLYVQTSGRRGETPEGMAMFSLEEVPEHWSETGAATVTLYLTPSGIEDMRFEYKSPFWLRDYVYHRAKIRRIGDL